MKEYAKLVTREPVQYYNNYLNTLTAAENSTAKFNDKTIPFLYHPMLFTTDDIKCFESMTDTLMGILNKVINEYLTSAGFREKFGFDKLLEELILLDHGYGINIPMARLDIFYYGPGVFKFCELNADGSSGMNKSNVLEEIFLNTSPINEMKDKYQITYLELINSWVEESLKNYQQFNPNNKKPNVAIVDWADAGNIKEFEAFKKAYQKKGCQTKIVDPRNLKYDGISLFYQDMKVDLIYRRLVTSELIERQNEISDFINAYRDRAVCVLGPLRSEIIHNKIIFKILHQNTKDILSVEEREFVERHIPHTFKFSGNKEIYQRVIRNKNDFVLKPKDLYAATGVYLGKDFSSGEWSKVVARCWENDYLVQEYCQPCLGELVEFKYGQAMLGTYNQMIGLFVYNEKFTGLYTRVGKNNVISDMHGYYILPNLVVKKRE